MNRKKVYRIIVASLAVILLSVGLYIGLQLSKKVQKQPEPVSEVINKNDNNNNVNVYVDENDKKTDIELVYEDYYKVCKKTITDSNMVYGISLNELKERETEKNRKDSKDYQVVSETPTKIVFRRELDQYCPEHYEIKLENGKVVIYNIVSEGVKTLYKETDIYETGLRPEVIEDLMEGKKVDSKEELNLFIEDIES
ncbi:MAG: hypothetical protein N2749_00260 [Clostridia bacterium]|nr:hypothetical protein [Clostridia bacterium]